MQETVIVILTFTWLLVSALTGIPGPFGPESGEPYLDDAKGEGEDTSIVPIGCKWEVVPFDWPEPDLKHYVEPPRDRDSVPSCHTLAGTPPVREEEVTS